MPEAQELFEIRKAAALARLGKSPSTLTGANRDAAEALIALFTDYGLGSLAPQIVQMIQDGFSADTITIKLRETKEYKERFAANETRRKKGLVDLSPAEYVATERSYRQIMAAAGMPVGFYDSNEDFRKFLENDVSPTELQGRVTIAQDALNNADSNVLDYFKQYYSSGEMVAYLLDANRAAPLIEKQYRSAQIGGAAARQGLALDVGTAESLAGSGVSATDAQAGFGFIAQELPNASKLADIYDEGGLTLSDLAQEVFQDNADTAKKRKKLASQERASFGKSSALTKSSLTSSGAGSL